MNNYLIKRIFRTIFTLWFLLTFLFILLRISGDPLRAVFETGTPQYIIDYYRSKWGLDKPLLTQYTDYLFNVLQGNLGISFFDGRPVTEHIAMKFPNTLLLGSVSFLTSVILGISLGAWAAFKSGKFVDKTIVSLTVFSYSMPNYFFGILMIYFLSLKLGWLPTGGIGNWKNLIMPIITLSTPSIAYIARFSRSTFLDILRKPYMRTADAKGIKLFRRLSKHLFPNAAIPIITVLGQQFGWIIGGAVITETIFAWPGIGRLLITAVSRRDYETIQGMVLLIGVSVTLTNLIVDLLYSLIDPRIRYGKENGN